jgi:DNA integrity scanning protein DisA with diadenylate cyclase activity
MKTQKFTDQFAQVYELAVKLCDVADADALLVMLDGPTDWERLKASSGQEKILVVADSADLLHGAHDAGLLTVVLDMHDSPVLERITQALIEAVADEILAPGANVVAVYSGFEAGTIDSASLIRLDEHLVRLSARDLRQLETSVPLDTLKTVVDLAVDIGREGREGKPMGAMFVVGDTRKVLHHCHPAGFDPVKGYKRQERNLRDAKVRESMKEIAQLDGAFIVNPDGIVEKSCQIVDATHANLTLSKGLGARHWAAAAISKCTNSVAIVVSESTGTVRLFQGGEVILRIEPFRRAMKWKDFEYERPLRQLLPPKPDEPAGAIPT